MKIIVLIFIFTSFISHSSFAYKNMVKRSMAPKGAKAYIVSPKDGATVKSPVKVVFGLEGMGVAPAGVKRAKTGHHHLIIDGKMVNYTQPIKSDDKHKHYGEGQTEAKVKLAPGPHTLQLVLADHRHIPHDPPIKSKVIKITVSK